MRFSSPLILLAFPPIVTYLVFVARPPDGHFRPRELLGLLLRILIALLVVVGLAGAKVVWKSGELSVVFLVDASDSMGFATYQAIEFVEDAIASMGPEDRAATVFFGADAVVERRMSPSPEMAPVASVVSPVQTDLAAAIRLGMALFPPQTAHRIVVLSDGIQTVGDAESAAGLAAASGVHLDYVAFPHTVGPEVLVSDIWLPSVVYAGESFDLTFNIQSRFDATTQVRVLRGDDVIYGETVELQPGDNNFALSLDAGSPGFITFTVIVEPEEDGFYQNNRLSAFTQVLGVPRVLIVAERDTDSAPLVAALEASGLAVDVSSPDGLSDDLASLGDYGVVVLVNVSASRLGSRFMELLEIYVRDLGGGLICVGGPDAYAPGGYYRTPLERTLPLEMLVRDQERVPQMTILFVIDRSGSMGAIGPDGYANLELAKEAVIRSLDMLTPLDRIGVIAFDTSPIWVVPVRQADNVGDIANMVATLRAGGGTSIYAGLAEAADTLPDDPSRLRHIVLLTDGGSDPRGIEEMIRDLHDRYNITTSVVAIGEQYALFLERVAQAGGGRFHLAYDVSTIPSIFTQEAAIARRSYIIEGEFYPRLLGQSRITEGIEAIPPLLGYVATEPKEAARVIMVGGEFSDPILAEWQYGLGRAIAWTSDAGGRWAPAWVGWDEFPEFWGRVVRRALSEGLGRISEVTVEMQGADASIILLAQDVTGEYINGLDVTATIVTPSLETLTVSLRQTAPGRYRGEFTPDIEGVYMIRVVGEPPEGSDIPAVTQTAGWVMSYSPEYVLRDYDPHMLARLAATTGGSELESPEAAFRHDFPAQEAVTPVWPWLLLAAVLLWPLDVGVRRLVITSEGVRWVRQAIAERLGLGGGVGGADRTRVTAPHLGRLKAVKKRVRLTVADEVISHRPVMDVDSKSPEEVAEGVTLPAPESRPIPRLESGSEDNGDTLSRLLKIKKRRRG